MVILMITGELVYQNNTLFSNNFSTTIVVPSNADTGVSRMRIMGLHSGNATDPCDTLMDGEAAEDYAILILGNGSGTGIYSSIKESQSLKIFPNSTNDKLFLKSLAGQRFETVKMWNLLGQKRSLPAFLAAHTPQFKPYMLQRRSLQLSLYYHQEMPSAKQKAIINSKVMITAFQNSVI